MMNLSISQGGSPSSHERTDLSESNAIWETLNDLDYLEVKPCSLPKKKWTSMIRYLRQLERQSAVMEVLRQLLPHRALWAQLDLRGLRILADIADRHAPEISKYLDTILQRWTRLTSGIGLATDLVDAESVKSLEGLWPRMSSRHRDCLDKLFSRTSFLPRVTDRSQRMALKRTMAELDGRLITFDTLLSHECHLLRQASAEQSGEPFGVYSAYWAPRFAALASKTHAAIPSGGRGASRNVYARDGELFTLCRVCDPTAQHKGIWRTSEDLRPYFSNPFKPDPRPTHKDLPLRSLLYDFIAAFFGVDDGVREQESGQPHSPLDVSGVEQNWRPSTWIVSVRK
jgi:hypothetical protein